MAVSIFCPHCQHQFKVPETAIGKKGRCPACKQVLTAELPVGALYEVVEKPEVAEKPVVEPEVQPVADEVPEPAPVRTRPRGGDEEPEAPPKKPRKVRPASQAFLRITVLFGGLAAAATCGVIFFLWQREQAEVSGIVALAEMFQGGNASTEGTKATDVLTAHRKVYPLMLVAACAGLVGGLLGVARIGVAGGLLMLAAVVAPAVIFPKTLVFTCALIVAGVLGLMMQSAAKAQRLAERAAEERRRPRSNPLVLVCAILGFLFFLGYAPLMGVVLVVAAAEQEKDIARIKGDRPGERKLDILGGGGGGGDKRPEPPKEVPAGDVREQITGSGSGTKLVKLDLSPAGLDATLEAPEGSQIKESYGTIRVTKDEHFGLTIELGRQHLHSARENLTGYGNKAVVNSGDLVFTDSSWGNKQSFNFTMMKVVGHQDVSVQNYTQFNDKSVEHSRADCLLMIRCAESLARKTPLPADPTSALAPFKAAPGYGEKEKPDEVRLNSKATDATLALLAKFPEIRVLNLSEAYVTDEGLAHLKALTKLEKLNVYRRPITDTGAATLAGFSQLKDLTVSYANITDAGVKSLAELPELETLDIGGGYSYSTKFKGPGLAHLAGAKKLKTLRLRGSEFDDSTLANLKTVTGLIELDLSSIKLLGPGLAQLKDLPNLTRLNVSGTQINDSGLESIAGLVRLEELDLHSTQLSGDGVKALKGMTKLRVLKLESTKIPDAGVAHLAKLTSLEVLNLGSTPITDAGWPT